MNGENPLESFSDIHILYSALLHTKKSVIPSNIKYGIIEETKLMPTGSYMTTLKLKEAGCIS